MWINTKIRLANDTKSITTKTGTPMRTGFCFADTGDDGFPMSVVAFNNMADALAKYHKGDVLVVSGSLQENNYTNKGGEEIKGWQCVIDNIAGVKKQSPTFAEKKQREGFEAAHKMYGQLNDEISF